MKKILVASDGSQNAQKAVRFALNLARKLSAELTFAHVIRVEPPTPLSSEDLDLKKSERAKELFDAFTGQAELAGIRQRTLVLAARSVADALIQESADHDLLVVGQRGIGGVEKLVLGSVSQAVVEKAACPVLVVK